MIVITEGKIHRDVAIAVTISDADIEEIKKNPKIVFDAETASKWTYSTGNNVFIMCLQTRLGVRTILKEMRGLLKNYDSVCWCDREYNKFYQRRRM